MKTTNTLRILAGLSFLIFFCPFFQMCSDEDIPRMTMHLAPIQPDSIAGDSIKIQAWEKSIEKEEEAKIKAEKRAYTEEHRKETILNAYEISYTYGNLFTKAGEIGPDDFTEPLFYFVVFFLLSVLTSLILFVLALLKKIKAVFISSYVNVVFIILYSLFLFVGDTPIEHLYQVKFGYYLFAINSIALIFVSYKAKNQPRHAV
jgi:hypothetical protein